MKHEPTCRGSWALGTACGRCATCQATDPLLQHPDPALGAAGFYRIDKDGREVCGFCRSASLEQLRSLVARALILVPEAQASWHQDAQAALGALEGAPEGGAA